MGKLFFLACGFIQIPTLSSCHWLVLMRELCFVYSGPIHQCLSSRVMNVYNSLTMTVMKTSGKKRKSHSLLTHNKPNDQSKSSLKLSTLVEFGYILVRYSFLLTLCVCIPACYKQSLYQLKSSDRSNKINNTRLDI